MKYYKNYHIKTEPRDVFLASYPRSGNTWVRFMLANIIAAHEKLGAGCDFANFRLMIPFDKHIVEKKVPQHTEFGIKEFPKIYKTHNVFSKKLKRSVYIVRDPRDTLVSYYHFQKFRKGKFSGNFSGYVRQRADDWCENVKSWEGKAGVMIRYEDIKKDPAKEMKKILKFLKKNVDEKMIRKAVRRSSFSAMQKNEAFERRKRRRGLADKRYFTVRKGEVGGWKKYFTPDDLEFLRDRIRRHNLGSWLVKHGYKI